MIRTILLTTAILSFGLTEQHMETAKYSICKSRACVCYARKLKASYNPSLNVCEDIYSSVCDGWKKKHAIPDSRTGIDQLSLLKDKAKKKVMGILQTPNGPDDPEVLKRARIVFKLCMDQAIRDSEGLGTLNKIIKEAGGWPMVHTTENKDATTWQHASKVYNRLGVEAPGLFQITVDLNDKNSSMHIIHITEPEFLLARTTFLENKEHNEKLKAYHEYIKGVARTLAESSGVSISNETLDDDATEVINMQSALKNITSPVDEKGYVHLTIRELQQMYDVGKPKGDVAHIDFLDMIRDQFSRIEYEIDSNQEVIVADPKYFFRLAGVLNDLPLRTVVNTIHATSILKLVPYTTSQMDILTFQAQKIFLGVQNAKEPWRQCLQLPNFEHALSFRYAKNNFHPKTKKKVLTMFSELKDVISTQIRESQWLDAATKAAAIYKVKAMIVLVGFPDWYSDEAINTYYENLTITASDFLGVAINLHKFQQDKELLNLRKSNDNNKNDFLMLSYEVQAGYNPLANSILITAGILQDPLYNENYTESLNYGALGRILGHEMTHGFSSLGRYYKNRQERELRSSQAEEEYTRTKCFVDQYNKYIVHNVLPLNKTVYVNGELTLSENIADYGGIRSAWNAWQMHRHLDDTEMDAVDLSDTEIRLPGLENVSADQLFFINAAFTSCENTRPAIAETEAIEEAHAPWHTRIVGSVSNLFVFSEIFDCPEGSGMNPVDKCTIW